MIRKYSIETKKMMKYIDIFLVVIISILLSIIINIVNSYPLNSTVDDTNFGNNTDVSFRDFAIDQTTPIVVQESHGIGMYIGGGVGGGIGCLFILGLIWWFCCRGCCCLW
jgi:hypothetical protein